MVFNPVMSNHRYILDLCGIAASSIIVPLSLSVSYVTLVPVSQLKFELLFVGPQATVKTFNSFYATP
jgi:hypothetical protein